jgi:transcriptional regulator with XRE-family HTH domain
MLIGERLRALREQKKMSQGDIEKRPAFFVGTFHGSRTGTSCLR